MTTNVERAPRRWGLGTGRVVAALVATLVVATGAAAHAQVPPTGALTPSTLKLPDGPGSVAGLAKPAELDLFSAQASYSVPIKVPTTGGLSPSVALSYSGALGNGPLGIGWTLSTPAIRRSLRNGVPRYDDTDEMTIEGVGNGRLVPFAASEYRVEGTGNSIRVRRLGDTFEVTASDGTRYLFGHTASSRVTDGARVAAWLLEDVVDLAGKTMHFTYSADRGELYPQQVTWGPDARYHLDVDLEDRVDTITSYATGFEITTARRIHALRTSVVVPGSDSQELARYSLAYDQLGPVSRLTGVTMTGRRDASGQLQPGSTMPPLAFTYAAPAPAHTWAVDSGGWVPEQRGVALVDIDGDGADDLLRLEAGNAMWRRNLGDHFGPAQTFSNASALELAKVRFIDVDGDARPELVRIVNDTWRAYSIQGSGISDGRVIDGSLGVSLGGGATALADVNGDGRTDVVEAVTSGLRIRNGLANGLSPAIYVPHISADDPTVEPGVSGVQLLDVNGDGLADVVWMTDAWMKIYLGRGNGTFASYAKVMYPWGTGAIPLDHIHLVDLDRDGLIDLVRVDAGKVRWYGGRAGLTFEPTPIELDRPTSSEADVRVTFADIDGNGSQEVVWSNTTSMWALDLAGGTTRSMVRTIDDGMGEVMTISYSTSTQLAWADEAAGSPWTSFVPRAIAVPVQQSTAYADGTPSRVVTLAARDGFWDGVERRFGGFLGGRTILPGDTPAGQRVDVAHFLAGTGSDRVLRGKPAEVRTEDGTGLVYSTATSTWVAIRPHSLDSAIDPSNPLLSCAALLSLETSNHEGVTTPIVTRVEHVYDAEVRSIEEHDFGRLDLVGDERTTTTQYASDDTTWVRDRVIEEALYHGIGTDPATLVSHRRHYFGNNVGDPLPLGQIGFGWSRMSEGLLWSGSSGPRWVTLSSTKYDALGNVIEATDGPTGVGVTHKVTYDPAGLFPTTESTVTGASKTVSWTATWDPVLGAASSVTDPLGNVSHVAYDGLGRVTAMAQNNAPAHAHYVYDWTAPRPRTFSYVFDGSKLAAYADQWQQSAKYVGWRHTVTVADSSGNALYSAGQLSSNQWLISGWKRKDGRGRVTEVLEGFTSTGADLPAAPPSGLRSQHITYDTLDRPILQVLPSGAKTQTFRQAFQQTVQMDGLAPVTSQVDGLGRVVHTERTINGSMESVDASYDAADRITALELQRPGDPGLPAPCTSDPTHARVAHCFTYDSLGRLVEADDPDIGLRQLTYDDAGRLIHHVNGAGQGITLSYDPAGRLLKRVADDGTAYEYHYDVDIGGGKLPGHLGWVKEPTGRIQFKYDEFGRTNYEYRDFGTATIFHDIIRAPSGALIGERYVRDWWVRTSRDMAGRVVEMDSQNGAIAMPLWKATGFDSAGRLTNEFFGNGVVSAYDFDVNGQTSHIGIKRSAKGASLYDVVLGRNEYGAVISAADGDGVGLDHSAAFNYDPAGRLIGATLGSAPTSGQPDKRFAFAYAYDGLQNMTSRQQPQGPRALGQYLGTHCYGENGAGPRQLTRIVTGMPSSGGADPCSKQGGTVVALSYDSAGRQTDDGSTHMTYNGLDQLVGVDIANPSGGGHVDYAYGYDGLRIRASDNMGSVREHWMTEDLHEQGGDYDQYIRTGDRIVAKVHLHFVNEVVNAAVASANVSRGVGAVLVILLGLLAILGVRAAPRRRRLRPALATLLIGALLIPACAPTLATQTQGPDLWHPMSVTYFHTGFAAGPVLLTGDSGTVIDERRSEPFGQAIDSYSDAGGVKDAIDYKVDPTNILNKPTDPRTGWSYHGARWMAPQTARWLTPDPPVKAPDGKFMAAPWKLNPYQYADQNPILFWDPNGRGVEEAMSPPVVATLTVAAEAVGETIFWPVAIGVGVSYVVTHPAGNVGCGDPVDCNIEMGDRWRDLENQKAELSKIESQPYRLEADIESAVRVNDDARELERENERLREQDLGVPQIGGSYGYVRMTATALGVGGEVHHTPAWNAMVLGGVGGKAADGLTTYAGAPSIWMTVEDHRLTASHGRQGADATDYRAEQAGLLRQGKVMEAVMMDVQDIRNLTGSKYDGAIGQMLEYVNQQYYDGQYGKDSP